MTDACVYGSQTVDNLLDKKDHGQELYADSAYVGQQDTLDKHQVKNKFIRKVIKTAILKETQQANNTEKSITRVPVRTYILFYGKLNR